MDKQDLILIIVILLLLVDFTDAVWGADIYYDNGSYASVPDEWVIIKAPEEHIPGRAPPGYELPSFPVPPEDERPLCEREPENTKCRRQREFMDD